MVRLPHGFMAATARHPCLFWSVYILLLGAERFKLTMYSVYTVHTAHRTDVPANPGIRRAASSVWVSNTARWHGS